MQIIRKNPRDIIPDIVEKDIDIKIFVVFAVSEDPRYEYVGYLIKNIKLPNTNIIECRVGQNSQIIGKDVWGFNAPGLIQALIQLWNISDETICYVLESGSDFNNILYKIENPIVINKIKLEVNQKFGGIT